MPAKKSVTAKGTVKKTTSKKSAATKSTVAKTTSKTARGASARPATPASSTHATSAQPGDLIVIDSAQVGSPPREGEILKVIAGAVSVRYQVRWADGHETLISPAAGTAHIVRT